MPELSIWVCQLHLTSSGNDETNGEWCNITDKPKFKIRQFSYDKKFLLYRQPP